MVLAAVPAGEARAGTQVDAAVEALRSAPIYNAPKAELGLSSADQSRVARAIAQDEPGPLYIAVLPDSARAETGGDTTELVRELGTGLRRPGTYVVLAGRQLGAASTLLASGEAGRLAGEAVDAHRGEGSAAVLTDLVHRVAQARNESSGEDAAARAPAQAGRARSGSWVCRRRRRLRLRSLPAAPARDRRPGGAAAASLAGRPRQPGR
jgi:hypothetical protein